MNGLIGESWRGVKAQGARFGLTALGIAWGAMMLTFLTSLMRGFEGHFIEEMEEVGPRIIFMGSGVVPAPGSRAQGGRTIGLDSDDINGMESRIEIGPTSPEIELFSVPTRAAGRSKLMRVSGIDQDAAWIRDSEIVSGRFINQLDVERRRRVAVIGPKAGVRIFGRENPIGRDLFLDGVRFHVIGVTRANGTQLLYPRDPEDLKIMIPYTAAQRWLTRSDEVSKFILAPLRPELGEAAIRGVKEQTALRERYDPRIESAMWSFNIQERIGLLRGLFAGVQIFMLIASVVTLFVAAVGVMNIMLVVVNERAQEIGLRKAIGARDRDVFLQILSEAALASFASGLAGAGFGIGLVQIIGLLIPSGAAFQAPPVLDALSVSVVTLSLIGVGCVSGLLPAIRAARIAPSEAMRLP